MRAANDWANLPAPGETIKTDSHTRDDSQEKTPLLRTTLSDLLVFVILFHSNDDISLFVPFVNIPVRLNNLFKRIASINDRF